jgi:LysM repeat protein
VAGAQTYRVKAGDTLSGIAARFGTTVAVLQRLNNIKDASRIKIGQLIKLP